MECPSLTAWTTSYLGHWALLWALHFMKDVDKHPGAKERACQQALHTSVSRNGLVNMQVTIFAWETLLLFCPVTLRANTLRPAGQSYIEYTRWVQCKIN